MTAAQKSTNHGPETQHNTTSAQQELADTQSVLKTALNQLQELAAANDSMDTLQAQLEGQSSALQQLQQSFSAAEAKRTEELKNALRR